MGLIGFQECGRRASIIWRVMQREGGAAAALKGSGDRREVARVAANENHHLHWQTPSGFVAQQNYVDQTSQVIKTTLGDSIRKHRLNTPTASIDKRRSVSSFPANFIHSLDASALVETINRSLDEAGTRSMSYWFVHDSYGTHAADAPDLARQLRAAHRWISECNPARSLRHDVLTGLSSSSKLPSELQVGSWAPSELEKARYFFT